MRVHLWFLLCVQIHITKPTWSNHHNIFKDAGVDKKEYRYYKPETKGLDFEGLIADLKVGPCINHLQSRLAALSMSVAAHRSCFSHELMALIHKCGTNAVCLLLHAVCLLVACDLNCEQHHV